MTQSLESMLDDLDTLEENRSFVEQEFRRLGEKPILDLMKKYAADGSLKAIHRLINLCLLLNTSFIFNDFPVPRNSRLRIASYIGNLFFLIEQFHIPVENWFEEAQGSCQILLAYLNSNVSDFMDLPEYPKWRDVMKLAEERLSKDPKFAPNFEKYPREMGQ